MRGFIYLIRNTVTGGGYVGQTASSPTRRWSVHKSILRRGKGNPRLQNSYNKHGESAFSFEILETVEAPALGSLKTLLTLREDAWMLDIRAAGGDLYNVKTAEESMAGKPATRIPGPSWNKGVPMSPDAKRRLSASKTGVPSPKKGVPMSEEQRQKVSASLKGNTRRKGTSTSQEARENISASKRGKPSSKKGTTLSTDQRTRLSNAHRGVKLSETHRAAQRAAAKGRSWTLVNGLRVYSRPSIEGAL